jgi:hypothetical protein
MFYEGKKITEAVEAYKNALRNTFGRRNEIHYAGQKMLKENPPKDDKDEKGQRRDKDKDKDKRQRQQG